MGAFWAKAVLGLVLCAAAAGCASSSSGGESIIDTRPPSSFGCSPASPAVISNVAYGFNEPSYKLVDAHMVTVPPEDQSTGGYPQLIVSGQITGASDGSTGNGTWAVGNSGSLESPIFAISPDASSMSAWGSAT